MYTIKEVAELMKLPTSTIRYYDKQDCSLLWSVPIPATASFLRLIWDC